MDDSKELFRIRYIRQPLFHISGSHLNWLQDVTSSIRDTVCLELDTHNRIGASFVNLTRQIPFQIPLSSVQTGTAAASCHKLRRTANPSFVFQSCMKTSGGRSTMCGSIAIPFRAAPAVSDICVSNDGPIRHYFPSRRRQAWTARARVTGISPLRGSLRAAPTACGCGWTGVSLLDCRRGSGRTPAESCRNAKQPATGCFMDGWEPLCTLFGRL